MFRQSIAFTPPVHGSDTPPPPQQQSQQQQQQPSVANVSESSRRQQQIAAASSSPVKSHPLHNFPLSDLRWAMNHANTHRLRKPSGRSPLREATNHGKGTEEVNEASGSSSFELRPPEKQKKNKDVASDSAADRSGTKSTAAADGRSKIFIRIRTKNNEEASDAAANTTAVSAATGVADVHETDDSSEPVIDADVSIGERISDGGGQEGDEFGPKTWNLRPRKPPTKKRSIGGSSGGALLTENKAQGTVRTEAIRSRNGVDAKIATTTAERKEKKPRLSISLSKMEIDEDIYSLTGSKPSRRPKKRAKNVQKQLDACGWVMFLQTLTRSQNMLERRYAIDSASSSLGFIFRRARDTVSTFESIESNFGFRLGPNWRQKCESDWLCSDRLICLLLM